MNHLRTSSQEPNFSISVVTVVKDNKKGLARTLDSLESQDFTNWEIVIVDGKSQDGSSQLAEEFSIKCLRSRVIHQNGSGIYDAMNLGLIRAKGEYLWFLNSGDVFANSQSLRNAHEIVTSKKPDILVGGYSYVEGAKTIEFTKAARWIRPIEISLNRRGLCHQSMIYRREVLLKVGGYDCAFTLASDFHSALQISKFGKVFRTREVLSRIELGGVSQSLILQVLDEKQRARHSVFGKWGLLSRLGHFWTILVIIKLKLRGIKC
jgi:glycosyltransferase involved in cell wall biosynthesis